MNSKLAAKQENGALYTYARLAAITSQIESICHYRGVDLDKSDFDKLTDDEREVVHNLLKETLAVQKYLLREQQLLRFTLIKGGL